MKQLGCGGAIFAMLLGWAVSAGAPDAPAAAPPPAGRGGLLFFATPDPRGDAAAASNPHLLGALLTVYWSEIEPREGAYKWKEVDRRVGLWVKAGKKVALRIMWVSSGNWAAPAADRPTPAWVLAKGAKVAVAEKTTRKTQIPLVWDPIYRKYASRFLREVARKFDGAPNVLFIDVTPGAETNPYRFRRINVIEPGLKKRFLDTAASDGRKYSHKLWLETGHKAADGAASTFKKTRVLVALTVGSLDGPEQFKEIGAHCLGKGCYVGQNGLNGKSYLEDSPRRRLFLDWGKKTRLYFEMVDPSGGRTGTL